MWRTLEIGPLPGDRDPEFCAQNGLAAVGPSGPVSDAVLARKPTRLCREGAIPPSHRAGLWLYFLLPYHANAADGSCATVAELRAKFARRWEIVAPTTVDGGGLLLPPPHFLTEAGVEAAARVLRALARTCDGVDSDDGAATGLARFSIVVRQLVAFALMYLPCESDAYGFVQTIWASGASSGAASRRGDDAWHLKASASKVDRAAACVSFASLVRRLMPKTFAAMSAVGALAPRYVMPLFDLRAFATLYSPRDAARALDCFVADGYKALYRYGLALLRVTKRQLKGEGLDADAWWARIAAITHSREFDANALHAAAYSPVYRGGVRPVRLRREGIARLHAQNALAVREQIFSGETDAFDAREDGDARASTNTTLTPAPIASGAMFSLELADAPASQSLADASMRAQLRELLPKRVQHRRLQLEYSTAHHGYSLDTLFRMGAAAAPNLLVVRTPGGAVFGAFGSDAWAPARAPFGTGECFLFRLAPPPAESFAWSMKEAAAGGEADDGAHEERPDIFMLATREFLAVGAHSDSTACGLKLSADLVSGSSEACSTFGNPPLAGAAVDFDIETVELFSFVL